MMFTMRMSEESVVLVLVVFVRAYHIVFVFVFACVCVCVHLPYESAFACSLAVVVQRDSRKWCCVCQHNCC